MLEDVFELVKSLLPRRRRTSPLMGSGPSSPGYAQRRLTASSLSKILVWRVAVAVRLKQNLSFPALRSFYGLAMPCAVPLSASLKKTSQKELSELSW